MRLIDADELIKSYLDHNRTEFEIKNCCMANENVIAIIVNAPKVDSINTAINTIKNCCNENNMCIHCPMNHNCNEHPAKWEEVKGGAENE